VRLRFIASDESNPQKLEKFLEKKVISCGDIKNNLN
jgi:hypothetical protein